MTWLKWENGNRCKNFLINAYLKKEKWICLGHFLKIHWQINSIFQVLVCFWWRLIQMEDRGLNKDIEFVNPLRSWTLKTWNIQNNKKRKFCGKVARQSITNYAFNFEEVVGAYWFRVVRASVCPSVGPFVTRFDACHILWTVHARVLKFHIWILYEKWLTRICFLVRVLSLSWVMLLWKNKNELLSARYLAKYLTYELETWSADRWWCVDNRINLWTNSVNFFGAMTL